MKKIIINICFLFFVFFVFDFGAWIYETYQLHIFNKDAKFDIKNFPSYFQNIKMPYDETTMRYFEQNKDVNGFRKPEGTEYKNKPIWLFGCSFLYGVDLAGQDKVKVEDNFAYKLAHLTQRPVYNNGYPSWGIQHMYYLLKKPDFYKDLPKPEYVIFVYISDHARRLNKIIYDPWSTGVYLNYFEKNGKLVQYEPWYEFILNTHIVRSILTTYEFKSSTDYSKIDRLFDKQIALFRASKEELEKHYPDTKFVILKFRGNDGFCREIMDNPKWTEIQDEFIILDTLELTGEDLTKPEYLAGDKYHPNANAWDVVSKAVANVINNL